MTDFFQTDSDSLEQKLANEYSDEFQEYIDQFADNYDELWPISFSRIETDISKLLKYEILNYYDDYSRAENISGSKEFQEVFKQGDYDKFRLMMRTLQRLRTKYLFFPYPVMIMIEEFFCSKSFARI